MVVGEAAAELAATTTEEDEAALEAAAAALVAEDATALEAPLDEDEEVVEPSEETVAFSAVVPAGQSR